RSDVASTRRSAERRAGLRPPPGRREGRPSPGARSRERRAGRPSPSRARGTGRAREREWRPGETDRDLRPGAVELGLHLLELALQLLDPAAQLEVPPLGELYCVPVALDGLPAPCRVMRRDRVGQLAGRRLVEELGRQPRRLGVVLEQRVEEPGPGAVLV